MKLNIVSEDDRLDIYEKTLSAVRSSILSNVFDNIVRRPYCTVSNVVKRATKTRGKLTGMVDVDYILRRYPHRSGQTDLLVLDRDLFDYSPGVRCNDIMEVQGASGKERAIVEFTEDDFFYGDVIHELSHTIGMNECNNESCVLHDDNDGIEFCENDRNKILMLYPITKIVV